MRWVGCDVNAFGGGQRAWGAANGEAGAEDAEGCGGGEGERETVAGPQRAGLHLYCLREGPLAASVYVEGEPSQKMW
jgi:hypothetical protein